MRARFRQDLLSWRQFTVAQDANRFTLATEHVSGPSVEPVTLPVAAGPDKKASSCPGQFYAALIQTTEA
jgi:hypothetical protein